MCLDHGAAAWLSDEIHGKRCKSSYPRTNEPSRNCSTIFTFMQICQPRTIRFLVNTKTAGEAAIFIFFRKCFFLKSNNNAYHIFGTPRMTGGLYAAISATRRTSTMSVTISAITSSRIITGNTLKSIYP